MRQPMRLLDLLILLLVGAAYGIILVLSDWPGGLTVENGPVEIMQLALLTAAAILFGRAALGMGGWEGAAAAGFTSLSLLGLVRETPRCSSPFYQFGPCIYDELKLFIYVAAGLAGCVLVLANRRLRPQFFGRAEFRRLGPFLVSLWPMLIIVVPVIVSQLSEHFGYSHTEEVLETLAYAGVAIFGLKAAHASDLAGAPSPRARPVRPASRA